MTFAGFPAILVGWFVTNIKLDWLGVPKAEELAWVSTYLSRFTVIIEHHIVIN